MTLELLPEIYAVYRLDPQAAQPTFAKATAFHSVTRTRDELSVVCEQSLVPATVERAERDWRALKVAGPLDFALTGILASIASPLADAKVSLFAVSTFDTDYILIKIKDLIRAQSALKKAGFDLTDSSAEGKVLI